MSTFEFLLPDAGEGLTEAEIVEWKVKPGDAVEVNQILVEIETAKSLVELPSPFAGTVTELLVEPGQTVDVGTVIIRASSGAEAGNSDAAAPAVSDDDALGSVADTASSISDETAAAEKPGAVLVGYGTKGGASSRRRRGAAVPAAPSAPATVPSARPASVPAAAASAIIAKPPIRKLAKDLGVTLADVTATGLAGEITRDDVIRNATQASLFRNIETPEWSPEREEKIPVKGVRKAIAAAMTQSAFTAPHVSVFVDIDATRTMEFVKRLKNSPDFAGIRVSPLLIAAKAVIWAVRRNPMVNATFTPEEITVHHYVNLGIAAVTPRGLVVPNVKDANELSLRELAVALEQLTLTARDGKTTAADMANGT
ncbi:dihydrolipoamide acetyltransferase family protein, partial [Conyzicola sp.]|uniref:dihydrolipoamide acetyltransferase family protein n=1 Tax=Conyzicola sp. TaxID=1969404 RepID=UPI003988E914